MKQGDEKCAASRTFMNVDIRTNHLPTHMTLFCVNNALNGCAALCSSSVLDATFFGVCRLLFMHYTFYGLSRTYQRDQVVSMR